MDTNLCSVPDIQFITSKFHSFSKRIKFPVQNVEFSDCGRKFFVENLIYRPTIRTCKICTLNQGSASLKIRLVPGNHRYPISKISSGPGTQQYPSLEISSVPSTRRYPTSQIFSVAGTQWYPISEIFSVPST